MKKNLLWIMSGCALFALAACGDDEDNNNTNDPTMQTASQYTLTDAQVGNATAMLTRYDERLIASGTANELSPSESYTVWWVFFNNVDSCSNNDTPSNLGVKCGPADFADTQFTAVDPAFGFCDGFVPDANGSATWTCERNVSEGDTGFELGVGLTKPRGAEVHMVIRTHGPTLTGTTATAQIETFNGGCNEGEPHFRPEGETQICADIQYYPFVP